MHFAYPPRKSSNPPPFRPRSSNLLMFRRGRLQALLLVLVCFLAGFYLLSGSKNPPQKPSPKRVPSGGPSVVIVTVIDPSTYNNAYLNTIRENREQYAERHGTIDAVASSYRERC